MKSLGGFFLGLPFVVGGLYLLAFKQVTRVFVDPRRSEFGAYQGDTVGDPTWVWFSAFLIAVGLGIILAHASRASGWRKGIAVGGLMLGAFALLVAHLTLFVNSYTAGFETDLISHFTASYLFHTGPEYSLIATFLLFLITLGFLAAFVLSAGYLLWPDRFLRSLWDRRDWGKVEAHVVVWSLLLVFGLTLFLVFLSRIAVHLTQEPLPSTSFMASNLTWFYYLQILFLGVLIVTVAARVFLINWGTQTPLDPKVVRESFANVTRVERAMVLAVLAFNALILMSPAAMDTEGISTDPVFRLNSRGLAWSLFFLAILYVPYAWGLRRLRVFAEDDKAVVRSPFSQWSLRLVLMHLSGLVMIAALGAAAAWGALGWMIAFAAWTGFVFLYGSVSVHLSRGLPEPRFRGAASPPLYFGFLLVAFATGIMMWGAGNTYVATYQESTQSIDPENESLYGADILFRLGGAVILVFTLLLSLALAKPRGAPQGSQLAAHVVAFLSFVALAMLVFSVAVWADQQVLSDAYAGFAFHQFYDEEKIMVAVLIGVLSAALAWSLSRITKTLLEPREASTGAGSLA